MKLCPICGRDEDHHGYCPAWMTTTGEWYVPRTYWIDWARKNEDKIPRGSFSEFERRICDIIPVAR